MHRMAQGVARRVFLKTCSCTVVTCLIVRCLSVLRPLPLFRTSLISSSLLSWSSSSMWSKPPSTKSTAHTQNEEYCPVAIHNPLTQPAWQLRLLRNFCSDLPEWIRRRRHGIVALVRCGTRRWAYRKSAIFTTVHSGARRTSEPETNLSLSWGKFVASSVLLHTYKYGETRVRTKFKFVSKTEIKSRPGKRANQDSPGKTKSKFLLKSELRSRSTNFKPILTEEVSRN